MSVKKMTRVALLGATLYVSQVGLSFLPNVELVSLLIVLYTLVFGKEAFLMIVVFNLFEGLQWGFGLWWISYLYTWPVLCLLVLGLKKVIKEEFLVWSIISGLFGLIFGAFFAIAYLPVDPSYALTYWITGLPWDVWHCCFNFILMLVLGKPLYRVLKILKVRVFPEEEM